MHMSVSGHKYKYTRSTLVSVVQQRCSDIKSDSHLILLVFCVCEVSQKL